jgi:uncharacterized membrane protein YccC
MLLAFATAAPLVFAFGASSRLIVFAVVVALQVARRPGPPRAWSLTLVALPVVAVLTSLLATVVQQNRSVGDVLVVLAFSASFASRNAPPVLARVGRLLSLPVVTLFVTPVPAAGRGRDLVWYLLLSLLAGLCAFASDRLLAGLAAGWALRAALADLPRLARRRGRSLRRAGCELDARIVALAGDAAGPLRRALLELELTGAAAPSRMAATLARLREHAEAVQFGRPARQQAERPGPPSRLRPSATTRVAIHAGLALALALVVAQHFYPERWSWAAVSVLAISGGLRSRGDVIVRGAERLVGALGGTLIATLAANALSRDHLLAVALILALITAGSLVRETTYVLYAFCVTSALALLYGVYGEQGTQLLSERLVENVIGAACVILPSSLLLPIRSEAVTRRRTAEVLASLNELLAALDADASPERIVEQSRVVDRTRNGLEDALRPLRIRARTLRLLGGESRRAAQLAARAAAYADAAHPLVYAALSGESKLADAKLRTLRQQVGALRRELASKPERPRGPGSAQSAG